MNLLKPLLLAVLLPAISATAQDKKQPAVNDIRTDQVIELSTSQSASMQVSKEEIRKMVEPKTMDMSTFAQTPTNLFYKIYKGNKSTRTGKIGDVAMVHIMYYLGDSLLIDSKLYNEGNPVPQQIEASKYPGDIAEGLQMLAAGDSGVFLISIDSLEARTGMKRPTFIANANYARWDVKMESVQSPEEFELTKKAMEQTQILEEDKEMRAYFAKNKITAVKTGTGLYFVIHKAGTGPEARVGQTVTVNYTGRLMNGKKFDSNVDPAFNHVSPFSFPLGAGRVIKGWDEAVQKLRKGGSMTVYIPSKLAYGPNSPSADIPANSVLVFDIELTDIAAAAPKMDAVDPGVSPAGIQSKKTNTAAPIKKVGYKKAPMKPSKK